MICQTEKHSLNFIIIIIIIIIIFFCVPYELLMYCFKIN